MVNLFHGFALASDDELSQLIAELQCKKFWANVKATVVGKLQDELRESATNRTPQRLMDDAMEERRASLRALSRRELEGQLRDELGKLAHSDDGRSDVALSVQILRQCCRDLAITGCLLPSQQAYLILSWWANQQEEQDDNTIGHDMNMHIRTAKKLVQKSGQVVRKAQQVQRVFRSVSKRGRGISNKLGWVSTGLDVAETLWKSSITIKDIWKQQKSLLPAAVAVAMPYLEEELHVEDSTLPSWVSDEAAISELQGDEELLSQVSARDQVRDEHQKRLQTLSVATQKRKATEQSLNTANTQHTNTGRELTEKQQQLPSLRTAEVQARSESLKVEEAGAPGGFFDNLKHGGRKLVAHVQLDKATANVTKCESRIESLTKEIATLDRNIAQLQTTLDEQISLTDEAELDVVAHRAVLFAAEEHLREQLSPRCAQITDHWRSCIPNVTALDDCLLWIATRPYHERLAIERMLTELHRSGEPAALALPGEYNNGEVEYPHRITSPDDPWKITTKAPAPYRLDFPLSDSSDATLYYRASANGQATCVWIGDIRSHAGAATATGQSAADSAMRHNLQEMRQALLEEIAEQQRTQAHAIRITNGHRYTRYNGTDCLYSFEAQIGRDVVPETPVVIIVNDQEPVNGRWIGRQEFTVLLALTTDLGETIPEARLTTQSGFIYHRLYEILQQLAESNADRLMLMKYLLRLSTPPANEEQEIVTQLQQMLPPELHPNADQRNAIARCAGSPLHFVWGPPGTGKSTSLAHLACALAMRGERVLVLSHTNIAVDVALSKIFELAQQGKLDMSDRVLRLGTPQMPDFPDAMRPECAVAHRYPEKVARRKTLEAQLLTAISSAQGAKVQPLLDQLQTLRAELDEVEAQLRSIEAQMITEARVIGATLSRLVIDNRVWDYEADAVIVDEASMAILPLLMVAAFNAGKRLLIFGDFRQLPPICFSPKASVQRWLARDAFEVSGVRAQVEAGRVSEMMTLLATQYRMAPAIAQLVNYFAYADQLVTPEEIITRTAPIAALSPCAGESVILVNTATWKPACVYEAGVKSHSRVNPLHAAFISALIAQLDTAHTSVSVITPYRAQAQLLQAACGEQCGVHIATVHRMQGQECDMAILDLVDAWPMKGASYLTGRDEDLSLRLLNVAISRPRGKVIILADIEFVRQCHADNSPTRKLLDFATAGGIVIDDPLSLLTAGPTAGTVWYHTWREAIPALVNCLNLVEKQCVIRLPTALSAEPTLLAAINACRSRHVTVENPTENANPSCPFVLCDSRNIFVGGRTPDTPVAFIDSLTLAEIIHAVLCGGVRPAQATDAGADTQTLSSEAVNDDEGSGELDEVFGYCDESCRPILTRCKEEGLPMPVVGYELTDVDGCVIAYAELAWPADSIAVLLLDQEEFRAQFVEHGWKLYTAEEYEDEGKRKKEEGRRTN